MQRLQQVNMQFASAGKGGKPAGRKLKPPVSDVWESMGMDQHLSSRAIKMRKETAAAMDACYSDMLKAVDSTDFPMWLPEKIKALGINGLQIKGYGSPGLGLLESAAQVYEIAKRDVSASTFFLVHNAIGMMVIYELGDDEQKERLLTKGMTFEKIFCFGLTEPQNGSDASALKSNARKVEGGYILNGQKRWIGNGTFGDVIVWARNENDGGRVQAFVVEKGSPGFVAKKMEGKLGLRFTQNADITMTDVFVPDKNKLTHSKDFATGTNKILESSRLTVAWMAAGCAAGVYEAAIKYCTKRVQFGKPIAGFQLIQERLSRMMANTEFTISHLARVTQ